MSDGFIVCDTLTHPSLTSHLALDCVCEVCGCCDAAGCDVDGCHCDGGCRCVGDDDVSGGAWHAVQPGISRTPAAAVKMCVMPCGEWLTLARSSGRLVAPVMSPR